MGDNGIRVKPANNEKSRDRLLSLVDEELALFDAWFTRSFPGNQGLSRYESSILKTYLVYALERDLSEE